MQILLVENFCFTSESLVVVVRYVLVLKPLKQSAYSKCHLL